MVVPPRAARSRAVEAMATRPASRQRRASSAAAAVAVVRSSPQPQQQQQQQLPIPQSGSPTSTTTTTTSSSRLTPELSLDGPASPLFAGLDEDPAPKENVTVTVRFRPLRFVSLCLWWWWCFVWSRLDFGGMQFDLGFGFRL